MDPHELATALRDLSAWATSHARDPDPPIRRRLREHLGAEPETLAVASEPLSAYDHPNVQVALDVELAREGVHAEILGLAVHQGYRSGLAELAQPDESYEPTPAAGPPEYARIDVGDRVVTALRAALLLVVDGEDRLVVTLMPAGHDEDGGLKLEAMARERETAEQWLARIRAAMNEHNVYRGKVVAFGGGSDPFRTPPLTVRRLPAISRERLILPDEDLARIERHTAGFARHAAALRAGGRHLKRGLLLHGPPGTGKTLTVMYLASLMPGRTVILLTGQALGAIGPACMLARALEPAMIVLEDVDLVARERMHYASGPLLFELLNAMDGLDEDADLLFVLTTNRPEVLEPALAARPGRIDLAVELPLPDAGARRRLIDLYGEGLDLRPGDRREVVAATDGVSPAFIRELMRRAALIGAETGGPIGDKELVRAAAELRPAGDRLSAMMLGAEQPPPTPGDFDDDDDGFLE
jgi:hypothetical protein